MTSLVSSAHRTPFEAVCRPFGSTLMNRFFPNGPLTTDSAYSNYSIAVVAEGRCDGLRGADGPDSGLDLLDEVKARERCHWAVHWGLLLGLTGGFYWGLMTASLRPPG